MLAEQEQPEQAGRERVQDREARLRGGQRTCGEGVRGKQQARCARADQDVDRPVGEDPGEAVVEVVAELLDHSRHETPGDARQRAQDGGALRVRPLHMAAQPERHPETAEHDRERDQASERHSEGGACCRPPDGEAANRNRPRPADMAAAASQSRRRTVREPRKAM